MLRWVLLLAALLVAVGCERKSVISVTRPALPTQPTTFTTYVQGTVSYQSGGLVPAARVWLAGDYLHAVVSDSLGWYAIPTEYIGHESLTVVAAKGTGVGTVSGTKKFVISHNGGAIVNLVCDHFAPI